MAETIHKANNFNGTISRLLSSSLLDATFKVKMKFTNEGFRRAAKLLLSRSDADSKYLAESAHHFDAQIVKHTCADAA